MSAQSITIVIFVSEGAVYGVDSNTPFYFAFDWLESLTTVWMYQPDINIQGLKCFSA